MDDLDFRLKQAEDRVKILEIRKRKLEEIINPLGRINLKEGDSERISNIIHNALRIEEKKGHTLRYAMITSEDEINITVCIIKSEKPPPSPKPPEPRFIKERDLGPKENEGKNEKL